MAPIGPTSAAGLRRRSNPRQTPRAFASDNQRPPDSRTITLGAARRVDTERRAEIGLDGERAVIRRAEANYLHRGHPDLIHSLRHVSLISDQLGYDIVAPAIDSGEDTRLEVKTCVSSAHLRIFLSRAEASWGSRDPLWYLVVCVLGDADEASVLGYLRGEQLADRLPKDPTQGCHRWESASILLTESELSPGLPIC